jgi:hypothetical protein
VTERFERSATELLKKPVKVVVLKVDFRGDLSRRTASSGETGLEVGAFLSIRHGRICPGRNPCKELSSVLKESILIGESKTAVQTPRTSRVSKKEKKKPAKPRSEQYGSLRQKKPKDSNKWDTFAIGSYALRKHIKKHRRQIVQPKKGACPEGRRK